MPLVGVAFLIAVVLISRRSSAPARTFLYMIGTVVAFLVVALLLALLIPSRAGALGSLAAIFGQITGVLVGIAHIKSLPPRIPQMPRKSE
jgi:ABC-type tungstate transport system substrate-binding protein